MCDMIIKTNTKRMKKISKTFLFVTLIVTAILLGFYALSGRVIAIEDCLYAIIIATIVSIIVLAVWFAIAYVISCPVARSLNKLFEMIGRYQ
jgi:hypothetical protein